MSKSALNDTWPAALRAIVCADPQHNGPGPCGNPKCWKSEVAKPDLSTRTDEELQRDLRYQDTPGVHTYGVGDCGHVARGCRVCADCIRQEIERRKKEAK